jgi:hypothetical protein
MRLLHVAYGLSLNGHRSAISCSFTNSLYGHIFHSVGYFSCEMEVGKQFCEILCLTGQNFRLLDARVCLGIAVLLGELCMRGYWTVVARRRTVCYPCTVFYDTDSTDFCSVWASLDKTNSFSNVTDESSSRHVVFNMQPASHIGTYRQCRPFDISLLREIKSRIAIAKATLNRKMTVYQQIELKFTKDISVVWCWNFGRF